MSKLIAIITAGFFAAATMLAADPNQCAQQIAECQASLAKLGLPGNAEPLKHALAIYGRQGCPPDGQKVIMQSVEATFYQFPKQGATFKAEGKVLPK